MDGYFMLFQDELHIKCVFIRRRELYDGERIIRRADKGTER